MAGFGQGFGAFADGLAKGMGIMRGIKHQEGLESLQERRMALEEQRYADMAEDARLQRQWDVEDRAHTVDERRKNQPFLDLQRQEKIDTLQETQNLQSGERRIFRDARESYDKLKGNSVMTSTNALGKPVWTYNGKEYGDAQGAEREFERMNGNFFDYTQKNYAPKVADMYLSAGKVQEAEAFSAWSKSKDTENGQRLAGAAVGQIRMGNWGLASKHLNDLAKDSNYIYMGDVEMTAEPIAPGEDAPNGGMRIKTRDKATGAEEITNITSQEQALDLMQLHISPHAVFEKNLAARDALLAAKSDEAKKQADHARAIDLKLVDSAMDKKGQETPEKYRERLAKRREALERNAGFGGAFSKMSEDEKAAYVVDTLKAEDAAVEQKFGQAAQTPQGMESGQTQTETPARSNSPTASQPMTGAYSAPDGVAAQQRYGAAPQQPLAKAGTPKGMEAGTAPKFQVYRP